MSRVLFIVCCIGAAFVLIGGGAPEQTGQPDPTGQPEQSGQAEVVTVVFPNDLAIINMEIFQGIASRFEDETGIPVDIQSPSLTEYPEYIANMLETGENIDLALISSPTIAGYVWFDLLHPLDDIVDSSLLQDMTPSMIKQSTFRSADGRSNRYGIGLTDSTVLLYGNRQYLEQIDARIPRSIDDAWTGEEFDEILQQLLLLPDVDWPLELYRNYSDDSEWLPYAFESIFLSGGRGFVDRDTATALGVLNSLQNIALAEAMRQWIEQEWVVPGEAGDDLFYTAQNVALAWGGHWIWDEAVEELGDNLVAIPLPNFGGGIRPPNGDWLWIAPITADSEAAGRFLSFMLSDVLYRQWLSRQNIYPGLASFAAEMPKYTDKSQMAIAFAQSEYAEPRIKHPAYGTISTVMQRALAKILNGSEASATLREAANMIDDEIDRNYSNGNDAVDIQ